VEYVYVAYNFSHFAIFLLKFIKIGGNLTKFSNTKMLLFSETRCIKSVNSFFIKRSETK